MPFAFDVLQCAISVSGVLGISYLWAEFTKKAIKTQFDLWDSAFSSPKDFSSSGSNDDDSIESEIDVAYRYLEYLKNDKKFLKKIEHEKSISPWISKLILEYLKTDKEFLKKLALELSKAGDGKKTE